MPSMVSQLSGQGVTPVGSRIDRRAALRPFAARPLAARRTRSTSRVLSSLPGNGEGKKDLRPSASVSAGKGAIGIGSTEGLLSFVPERVAVSSQTRQEEYYSSSAPMSSALPKRKTKMVCTIGPATWDRETLFRLADSGMNVARLNMSHGDHKSHGAVIELIREYNNLGRGNVALLLDTKGPEVRSGDLKAPIMLKAGEEYVFTTKSGANGSDNRIGVNYDGFVDDVSVDDILLVDGGIQTFKVKSKTKTDVTVEVIDGGEFKSRRHLNIRGKSANLPAITDRDWEDLKFGVQMNVDYFALSFVRDAKVIHDLKAFVSEQGARIGVLAKIESADSVHNLEEILDAVDGAMVARGDLGAELPVEEVPFWQNKIVQGCKKRGKPVIVATNMLESMIDNPTPTRAEVSDISIAVREGTDAIMLSGESAYGKFPFKAVDVMSTVAFQTERAMLSYAGSRRYGTPESDSIDWITPPQWRGSTQAGISEMFAYHATIMANTLKTSLVVFTRKGNMPALLSHYRPDNIIYAFTDNEKVIQLLALYHGVQAYKCTFAPDAEETIESAMTVLKARGEVAPGQLLAIVQSGRKPIWRSASTHNIQVRPVPLDPVDPSSDDDDFIGQGQLKLSMEMKRSMDKGGNALPGM